jgi:hypothetical protein
MIYEEALGWLRGNRSMLNDISSDFTALWVVRTAEADAAMVQPAYWIVRAHNEGLINDH